MKTEAAGRIELKPGERVAIVAGSGRLPIDIAERLAEQGHPPFVIMVEGEADPASALARYEHATLPLESILDVVGLARKHGITYGVLAGAIGRRPRLLAMRPSLALLKVLPALAVGLTRGDDSLLRVGVSAALAGDMKLVGAHELLPDLLAAEGSLGSIRPTTGDRRDLDSALAAARAIGALDIGQGAVSIGGRVVALEGIEGTDGMLERVRDLRGHGRLAGKARGVLVKCSKPGQELRVDLPAIGPQTVVNAHAAGLAGIGVEAGRSLVLDQAGVIAEADRLGLFVVGLAAATP